MKTLLVARIDGRLTGLLRRYAEAHLAQCPQCRAALDALQKIGERLAALRDAPTAGALSPEREAAIARAWDDAERRKTRQEFPGDTDKPSG